MAGPEGFTLVHTVRMPIRWGDMDAMGHVNNTVYFRFLEQARLDWFLAIGCPPVPTDSGPVIINAHCTFLKQLRYPGDIEVSTLIGPLGRSSFEARQQIRRVDDMATVAAEGGAKVVWVDYKNEKSIALTEELRERLRRPVL